MRKILSKLLRARAADPAPDPVGNRFEFVVAEGDRAIARYNRLARGQETVEDRLWAGLGGSPSGKG